MDLMLTREPTAQDLKDLRDCAFFVQTVYHLQPIKGVDPRTMRAYAEAAERVQALVVRDASRAAGGGAAGGGGAVQGGA